MDASNNLYIATNLEDLKKLAEALPKDLKGINTLKSLEKCLKRIYAEILAQSTDPEKGYIFCYRYLLVIEILCRKGDKSFYESLYRSEISSVNQRLKELGPKLENQYILREVRRKEERIANLPKKLSVSDVKDQSGDKGKLFPSEFITVKDLVNAIQLNANMLIVDIRPTDDYVQSKIKFEDNINVPDELLVAGLSAHVLGQKLKDDTQKIWDKRDKFDALVFIDWNSSPDNITLSKLTYLKDSIVEWDGLRTYKQPPVILNGGFKEFLDSYPGSVTNVHVNFIRNNEEIDELLELDKISYPEPDENVSIMPLKQYTIEKLEESTKGDEDQMMYEETSSVESDSSEFEGMPEESAHDTKPLTPRGGRPAVEQSTTHDLVHSTEDLKNKIEEDRLKLLKDARNKKNAALIYQDNNVSDTIGDKLRMVVKGVPPIIRRDNKPKQVEFVFEGWCGLVNIKNTCYMNTVLQCLKCIPIIRNVIHSSKYVPQRTPKIYNYFTDVIMLLCKGTEDNRKVYRPTAFYDTICRLDPVYKKGNHEDCMEFFLFLFNHLHEDFLRDIEKNNKVLTGREKAWYTHLQGRTSVWADLFYHQFQCTKICQTCHSTADSYETDNTLMLPVPYRPGLTSVRLRDLYNEYLEDNQILDYKCSKCQNLGVINKKKVVVAPEILVIVLKRYYQDEYQESRKNNMIVDFDMNFEFGNCHYKLYSVAEHRGTMDHGHYFAHGQLSNSMWVEFNDERTTRYMGDWDNVRGAACAFFYYKHSG